MKNLFDVENFRFIPGNTEYITKKTLLVSVNPDLKSDFGHFLNYERRLSEVCDYNKIDYICLANEKFYSKDNRIKSIFIDDSGHYSLTRKSAQGNELKIAANFIEIVEKQIKDLDIESKYDNIIIFLYCGSSLLASYLCDFPSFNRWTCVINAFWDFLLPKNYLNYEHLVRIKFQNNIKLLGMSNLHCKEIFSKTGIDFNHIKNPPPLANDVSAADFIKTLWVEKAGREVECVFLPGLMTAGKGGDFTHALCDYIVKKNVNGLNFLIRDRRSELPKIENSSLCKLEGDFSDKEIAEFYRRADVAILPYDASTFSVRTSGAIVDCMLFGVIPIVQEGTWLANICSEFGFGRVLSEMTPDTVMSAMIDIKSNINNDRYYLMIGSLKYLSLNSWIGLVGDLLSYNITEQCANGYEEEKYEGLFPLSNALYRKGYYKEAAAGYAWLLNEGCISAYKSNLSMSLKKLNVSDDNWDKYIFG
jgi:hypothetical protein